MNWEWLKDIGWVGTTLVALGGLAATVWTGRRSGQVQLAVQEKQLEENRRILEWQERRVAYAQFLRQFQEYFDMVTTQDQIDAIVKTNMENVGTTSTEAKALMDAGLDDVTKNQIMQATQSMQDNIGDNVQAKYGVLTMREGWVLQTQVRDAANQARLISPVSVREGIDALMRAATKEEIEAAVKADLLIVDFKAKVESEKSALNLLMNQDLLTNAMGRVPR